MSSHTIHHLLNEYGLLVVFVAVGLQAFCVPIPGGTFLVVAAVLASGHELPIVGVIAAGSLGAFTGTSLGYAVGRWRGEQVLLRFGRLLRQKPEKVRELQEQFAAHAVAAMFIGRLITGLRNITGLLAGSSGMPPARFLVANAAAATASCTLIGVEYFYFGHAFLGAANWLKVVLVIVGIGAAFLSLSLLRRQAAERLAARSRPASEPSE